MTDLSSGNDPCVRPVCSTGERASGNLSIVCVRKWLEISRDPFPQSSFPPPQSRPTLKRLGTQPGQLAFLVGIPWKQPPIDINR